MKPNPICKDCWRWEEFKEECIYFWEGKKVCTKYMQGKYSDSEYIEEPNIIIVNRI